MPTGTRARRRVLERRPPMSKGARPRRSETMGRNDSGHAIAQTATLSALSSEPFVDSANGVKARALQHASQRTSGGPIMLRTISLSADLGIITAYGHPAGVEVRSPAQRRSTLAA